MSLLKITILIDDFNGAVKGFIPSYGIAVLIEIDGKKILFDTGTKIDPLIANFEVYGVTPTELDAVILSHNHYDHTDGLPYILKHNVNIPVYIHKDWEKAASFKGFQVPQKNKIVIQRARQLKEITSKIFLTNSYYSSDYGGVYEHACYIKANDSYILLCGCCHPGLNRFLKDREILNIPKNTSLHLIGGMHGFKFNKNEAEELKPIIKSVNLFHCTMNAKIFREQFGEICSLGILGKTMKFP